MKRSIRRTLGYIARKLGVHRYVAPPAALYCLALKPLGWIRSSREKASVAADGSPVPWWTYAATRFIEARISPDFAVFEFGAGNSTLWWAARVAHVTAVEHDPAWHAAFSESLPPNARCVLRALGDGGYSRAAVAAGRLFDVVVIDGRERVECARHCVAALKPEGVIVWDDSDRPEFAEGFGLLAEHGFREVTFAGLRPISPTMTSTSVLYRDRNCLRL